MCHALLLANNARAGQSHARKRERSRLTISQARSRKSVMAIMMPRIPSPDGQYQQRRHREKTHWYGLQNLIVDGGVIVGGLVLTGATNEAGGVVLVTGYFFGGPIVHWSHGQVGRGFASLGIRVAAPLLFAGLGYAVTVVALRAPCISRS